MLFRSLAGSGQHCGADAPGNIGKTCTVTAGDTPKYELTVVDCTVLNCGKCSAAATCVECGAGFGFNGAACDGCATDKCDTCGVDHRVCTACKDSKNPVNGGALCVTTEIPNC